MQEKIRKYLQAHSIKLMDKIDILKMQNADTDLIELIERLRNICSISVLNLDDIADIELQNIRDVLALCDKMLEDQENIEKYFVPMNEILNKLEDFYRTKKILLDDKNKMSKVA